MYLNTTPEADLEIIHYFFWRGASYGNLGIQPICDKKILLTSSMVWNGNIPWEPHWQKFVDDKWDERAAQIWDA